MNILSKTMIGVGLILMTANASFAGSINQREHNQVHRIFKGVANGSLTYAEFLKLAKAQAMIRKLESRARANGSINPLERFAIDQALNYQSVLIYNKKH